MKEIEKEVEKNYEREKAFERGGEEEAKKVEEDYDIRQSKAKAEEILERMRDKIERA